jgi:SNF2 family DNA or RNA helicase
MTLKQRDDALDKIEDDPNIKVMIAGLKCGGQGLNFQFANRGIIT